MAAQTVTPDASSGARSATFAEEVLAIADAVTAVPAAEATIRAGTIAARLRFASAGIAAQIAPSFAFTGGDDAAPALSIGLWDDTTRAPPLPPLPWPPEAYRACGEIAGYSDGRYYVRLDVPMQALGVLDTNTGRAAYVCRDPFLLPSHEVATPLRWLLHRAAIDRGMVLAHCAAAAAEGRGVLLLGPRGAGKSTSTLAAIAGGLDSLGDDRCLVAAGAVPAVHGVYARAKLYPADVERFGERIRRAAFRPPQDLDGKLHMRLDHVAEGGPARSAALAAILVLRRSGEARSHLVPIAAAAATRLLVSEIIGQSPVTAARSLAIVSDLCRRVPALALHAGTDMAHLAATIRAAATT